MKRWAVTGPIGAGKSAVTDLLAARGAAVVDGDALGHEVLEQPPVRAALVQAFGPGIVADGRVDRAALGRLVFADGADLARLDSLTHGPLAALAAERLDALEHSGQHALAVFEAAVYFRLPSPPRMDLVIVVNAPPALRARRLTAARGVDAAAAAARIAAQAPWDRFWDRADYLLVNDGTRADLALAVDALWRTHGPPGREPSCQGDPLP